MLISKGGVPFLLNTKHRWIPNLTFKLMFSQWWSSFFPLTITVYYKALRQLEATTHLAHDGVVEILGNYCSWRMSESNQTYLEIINYYPLYKAMNNEYLVINFFNSERNCIKNIISPDMDWSFKLIIPF